MIAGVDVGGTFTDAVGFDGDAVRVLKVATTGDQAVGVGMASTALLEGRSARLLHGTTTATNALLEGRTARTVLVTTSGFEDVLEIARQSRPSLYDPFADRPEPLVPRQLRLGVSDGDPSRVAAEVSSLGPEAIAVALLRSHIDPASEAQLAQAIATAMPGVPLSAAYRVSPEFREFERISTTVVSAALTPVVGRYLEHLREVLADAEILVMTSSGGLLPLSEAVERAGSLLLSGPAAGAVAAGALGAARALDAVMAFDMGGTSTDVAWITGAEPEVAFGRKVGGYTNRVPSVAVHTVGAGGGSIAWVDQGGALRVGPRSAGADPGPACYDAGGLEATVTDAHVVLGRIPSDIRFGGRLEIKREPALEAVTRLGERVGLETTRVAGGILEIVDTHMGNALRAVSVEMGNDPRRAALVAYGGAGGLHATSLARKLGIGVVLIPPNAGVFSALGLLLAAPRLDLARTVLLREGDRRLAAEVGRMSAEAGHAYSKTHGEPPAELSLGVDARYAGQAYELPVEVAASGVWEEVRKSFESLHRRRNGFDRPGAPIEAVTVRAVARGEPPLRWPDLPVLPRGARAPQPKSTEVHVGDQVEAVPLIDRPTLPAGFEMVGPAIIVDDNSAIWLEHDDRASVLDDGTIQVST